MQHEDLMIFDPTAVKAIGKKSSVTTFRFIWKSAWAREVLLEQAMRNLMSTLLESRNTKASLWFPWIKWLLTNPPI